MCAYCYVALGTVVGGVAIAKVGGGAVLKSTLVGLVTRFAVFRR